MRYLRLSLCLSFVLPVYFLDISGYCLYTTLLLPGYRLYEYLVLSVMGEISLKRIPKTTQDDTRRQQGEAPKLFPIGDE